MQRALVNILMKCTPPDLVSAYICGCCVLKAHEENISLLLVSLNVGGLSLVVVVVHDNDFLNACPMRSCIVDDTQYMDGHGFSGASAALHSPFLGYRENYSTRMNHERTGSSNKIELRLRS